MRVPIVGGNWKMNGTRAAARALVQEFAAGLDGVTAEVVLCPPFVHLAEVGALIAGRRAQLGAQNCHEAAAGAQTGEISAAMLADLGCRWVILGHSERRHAPEGAESDARIRRKLDAALKAGLRVIWCLGETQAEREDGRTEAVLERQLDGSLAGLPADAWASLVLAYEPVWAIGTGLTASAAQAQEAHAFIRRWVADHAGEPVAQALRLQYGGSVKPANAAELFGQRDVDGGLIGGASLVAKDFLAIVRAAGGG